MSGNQTTEKKRPLPFSYQFLAGGIAGTSEILIMYPLDVVKTRFQLQSGQSGQHYSSVFDCFKRIIKEEGFGRLYRGIIPPIMMEAPKRAIKFAANEQYGSLYKNLNLSGPLVPVLTGISAGCTEAFIVVPFDLVKIRLQDKASAGKYLNTIDCVRKVVKHEGILAFYKGLESTLWRHGVWSGIYFGCIANIKTSSSMNFLKENYKLNDLQVNFIAGLMGGTLGTLGNTPFDVLKTRIQNNVVTGFALPGIVQIARQEGIRSLWKGFVPKVMRLGPGGGIMLVMYDYICDYIRNNVMNKQ